MKQHTETKQTPALSKQEIVDLVGKVYQEKGQSSAKEEAYKYDIVVDEWCEPCDCESPSIDHECLICGSKTQPSPSTHGEDKLNELPFNGEWVLRPFGRTKFEMCLINITKESEKRFCVIDLRDIDNLSDAEKIGVLFEEAKNMYLALKDVEATLEEQLTEDAKENEDIIELRNKIESILNRINQK